MKNSSLVVLIIAIVVILVTGGVGYYIMINDEGKVPQGIVAGDYNIFTGVIESINGNSAIVKPNEGESILSSADKINIDLMNGKYNVGEEVEVTYAGPVMESYPAQVNVMRIKSVQYSATAALYTRLIDDIMNSETALNSKAEFVAIDFNNFKDVKGEALSQEDKDAIVKFLGKYHKNIKVATMNELKEQGYFDEEHLVLAGVLLSISEIDIKNENHIIVDMTKYRSGLGALFPTYEAKYKNGQWTYEIIKMFIS